MIENLACHEMWTEFLEYKSSKKLLTPKEEQFLSSYINNKKYMPVAERVISGEFSFSIPEKKELNKLGSAKKRVVYCFPEEENILLKMISYLLYEYDETIPDNCYAFRRNTGARNAFLNMANIVGIQDLYGFKADISNYFNSIDTGLLLPLLREVINDDPILLNLLTDLLCNDNALWQGDIIKEPRGVMAGTPTSPFFANIYLREMDEYFAERDVLYARYSDDILIFGKKEEMEGYVEAYNAF